MMSDFELRELHCISEPKNFNDFEIDWSFFALFSKIIENVNGVGQYVS